MSEAAPSGVDPELELEPDEPLDRATARRLLALALPEWRALALATLSLLIGGAAGLAYPQALRWIIDDLGAASTRALDRHVLAMVGIVAVQSIAVAGRIYLFSLAGERIVTRLRESLYRHLLRQEIAFFDRRRTGELVSRLSNDATTLQNTVTVDVSSALRNALFVVGGLALMSTTSGRLTLLLLAIVPPIALGAVLLGRGIHRLSRQAQDALAQATSTAEQALGGIRTVRAFAREEDEGRRYGDAVWRTFGLHRRTAGRIAAFVGTSLFTSYTALAVLMWLGLRQVMAGALTGGELAAFLTYGVTVAFSIAGLGELWSDLMRARGAASRVFGLLDREPELPPGRERPEAVRGRLELRDVDFHYPGRPDVPVLRGVSFAIEPGEVLALVGPSGAGKSTVAALVLRFYDPVRGAVLLDGRDVRELDPVWLRRRIGTVAQEPVLFAASALENIRYGRPEASEAEVEAAARAANAHDFLAALPEGYRTQVGERGVQLSGGQRQRVAIARALLADPRLLILDEATSSLDAESEALVKEALERLMRDRTSLVIAHRLSTVRDADRVVVMDGGRVVQAGTHDALMAEDGLYRRLVERQLERR